MPEDKLKKLYNNAKSKFDMPDYNTFVADMGDEDKRLRFYESISKEFDVPDYETFSSDLGLKKKEKTTESLSGSPKTAPSESTSQSIPESEERSRFDKKTNENKTLPWVKRAQDPNAKWLTNENGQKESHLLASSAIDGGKAIVYPTIIEKDGELIRMSPKEAYEYAKKTKTAMVFDSEEEALAYSKNGLIDHTPRSSFLEKGVQQSTRVDIGEDSVNPDLSKEVNQTVDAIKAGQDGEKSRQIQQATANLERQTTKAKELGMTVKEYRSDVVELRYASQFLNEEQKKEYLLHKTVEDLAGVVEGLDPEKESTKPIIARYNKAKAEEANYRVDKITNVLAEIRKMRSEIPGSSDTERQEIIERTNKLMASIKPFVNPVQEAKMVAQKEEVQKMPGANHLERIENYYHSKLAELEELNENTSAARVYAENLPLGSLIGDKSRRIQALNQEIKELTPIVLNNRKELQEDSWLTQAAKSFGEASGLPTKPTEQKSAGIIQNAMSMSDAELTEDAQKALEESYRMTTGEEWGSTLGLTTGMLKDFALGGGVTTLAKLNKAGRYFDKLADTNKFSKYLLGSVETGVQYKMAGIIGNSETIKDEASFISGFLGAAISKSLGGMAERVYVGQMKKMWGTKAGDITLKFAERIGAGAGEVLEEYGNELGSVINESDGTIKQVVDLWEKRFGEPDAHTKFMLMTFTMGMGFGTATKAGQSFVEKHQHWYNEAPPEVQAQFDEVKAEIEGDVEEFKKSEFPEESKKPPQDPPTAGQTEGVKEEKVEEVEEKPKEPQTFKVFRSGEEGNFYAKEKEHAEGYGSDVKESEITLKKPLNLNEWNKKFEEAGGTPPQKNRPLLTMHQDFVDDNWNVATMNMEIQVGKEFAAEFQKELAESDGIIGKDVGHEQKGDVYYVKPQDAKVEEELKTGDTVDLSPDVTKEAAEDTKTPKEEGKAAEETRQDVQEVKKADTEVDDKPVYKTGKNSVVKTKGQARVKYDKQSKVKDGDGEKPQYQTVNSNFEVLGKDGEPVSRPTRRNVLTKRAKEMTVEPVDLSNVATEEELLDTIAEKSQSPREIAEALISEPSTEETFVGTKDWAIQQVIGKGPVSKASVFEHGDKNVITPGQQKAYSMSKKGPTLDQLAQNAEMLMTEDYGNNSITPADIYEFIQKYKAGSSQATAANRPKIYSDLEARFTEVTGLLPTQKVLEQLTDHLNTSGNTNFDEFLTLDDDYVAGKDKVDKQAQKDNSQSQKDKVKKVLAKKEEANIKEIAEETGILEPNVRRILGVGAKDGTFERIAPGVYKLSIDGEDMVYLHNKDAVSELPKLAADGLKADMVFLDIPYDTPAVKGGNRGVKYDLISVEDFKTIVEAIKKIAKDINTPIIHMYSNAKSGLDKMMKYNEVLSDSGFKVIGKGYYKKYFKNGQPTTTPQGKEATPEGILVYNQTGKTNLKLDNFEFHLERPPRGTYPTEKPGEMIKDMIEATTVVGDMILDPFAGSGVVGDEALKADRKATLIEKSTKASEDIKKRVQRTAKEKSNGKEKTKPKSDKLPKSQESGKRKVPKKASTGTKTPRKAKGVKSLYKINREVFGLNRAQALANAIVMDKSIGVMAKRAKITKAKMYGRIEFRKGDSTTEAELREGNKALFKGKDGEANFEKWKGENTEYSGTNIQDVKTGEPVVVRVYHGTTNEFYEFDSSVKGTIEGHFGRVNYFTSDEGDASQNYQSDGPDLTNRKENREERITQDIEDNTDGTDEDIYDYVSNVYPDFDVSSLDNDMSPAEVAERIASSELDGGEDKVLDTYVKLNNPVVLGKTTEWVELIPKELYEDSIEDAAQEIADEYDITLEEAKEDYQWDIEQRAMEIEGVENPLIEALNDAIYENTYGDESTVNGKGAYEILADFTFDSEVNLDQLEKAIREGVVYAENEDGDMSSSQIVSDFFKNLGYDGIILTNPSQRFQNMGLGRGTSHVHVFDEFSNQIKLADGSNVNFGETKDIRFQDAAQETPIWKSTASEGVSKLSNNPRNPGQWIKGIQDRGGKGTAQELEWIGLKDFLDDYIKSNNTKSIPKEVVEQYIADNQIEIVEVVKGSPIKEQESRKSKIETVKNRLRSEKGITLTQDMSGEWMALKNGEEVDYDSADQETTDLLDELEELVEDDGDLYEDTQYGNWTLEGGKNYREVLLTLPNKKDSYRSSHWDESNILAHVRLNERTLPNGEKVLFVEEIQSDWAQVGKKKGFKEKKNLKPIKLKEENGIEVWSVGEVRILKYLDTQEYQVVGGRRGSHLTFNFDEAVSLAIRDYPISQGVPDMPYKKTDQWVGMAGRRVLKLAADEGFDRVAWVTGDQSADRYDLSKQVDRIYYYQNGTLEVVGTNGDIIHDKKVLPEELESYVGKEVAVKLKTQREKQFNEQVDSIVEEAVKGGMNPKQAKEDVLFLMENPIGTQERPTMKQWDRLNSAVDNEIDLNEEITDFKDDVRSSLEGDGLKVGGEGMKTFYNSILPKVMGKEAKRFDKKAKVEVVDFQGKSQYMLDEGSGRELTEQEKLEGVVNKQLSIPITPEARMNLNGAIPLFQGAQGAMLADNGKFIIYALTNPNVSTPMHEMAHVYESFLDAKEKAIITKWAGTDSWTTETSEKFARGFEKYLATGKAPSSRFQKIFDRFKEWLTEIYKGITGSDIDIELSPKMEEIYANMLGESYVKPKEKTKAEKRKKLDDDIDAQIKALKSALGNMNMGVPGKAFEEAAVLISLYAKKGIYAIEDIIDSLKGKISKDMEKAIRQAHAESDPKTTSLKNERIKDIRNEFNLETLPDPVKKAWTTSYNNAVSQGKQTKKQASATAAAALAGESISEEEHIGLSLREAELENQLDMAHEELANANEDQISEVKKRIKELTKEVDIITKAARKAGNEAGRRLGIRRLAINLDNYSITRMTRIAEKLKGEALTDAEQAKITELSKQIKAQQKVIEDLNKRAEELEAKRLELEAKLQIKAEVREKLKARKSATRKERIANDRKVAKDEIFSIMNRANDITSLSTDMPRALYKLAKTYIEEGVVTLEELTEKMRKDIPEITDRDVRIALISGNSKSKKSALTETQKDIKNLKEQAKIIEEIENLESGITKEANKEKPNKTVYTKKTIALRAKLADLLLKQKNNELLQELIKAADGIEESIMTDGEVDLKAKVKALKDLLKTQEEIDKYQKAVKDLKSKDKKTREAAEDVILPKAKIEVSKTNEFQQKLNEERAKLALIKKNAKAHAESMKTRTMGEKFKDARNIIRTLKATLDLSGSFRQGAVAMLLTGRLDHVLTAMKAMNSDLKTEEIFQSMMNHQNQIYREASGLELTEPGTSESEEYFVSDAPKRWKATGWFVKPSERHMATVLNLLRVTMFDTYLEKHYKSGENVDMEDLAKFARWVNVATGRGQITKDAYKGFEEVLFAPKYTISRFQMLAEGPKSAWNLINGTATQADKSIVKQYVRGALTVYLIKQILNLLGGEDELDPRDSDFLKTVWGNTRYDIMAGEAQVLRAIGQTIFKSLEAFKVVDKSKDPNHFGYGNSSILNIWGKFIQYKLHPAISASLSVMQRKDIIGKPFAAYDYRKKYETDLGVKVGGGWLNAGQVASAVFVPITITEAYDEYSLNRADAATLNLTLTALGVGVSSYDNPKREQEAKNFFSKIKYSPKGTSQSVPAWIREDKMLSSAYNAEFAEKYMDWLTQTKYYKNNDGKGKAAMRYKAKFLRKKLTADYSKRFKEEKELFKKKTKETE